MTLREIASVILRLWVSIRFSLALEATEPSAQELSRNEMLSGLKQNAFILKRTKTNSAVPPRFIFIERCSLEPTHVA